LFRSGEQMRAGTARETASLTIRILNHRRLYIKRNWVALSLNMMRCEAIHDGEIFPNHRSWPCWPWLGLRRGLAFLPVRFFWHTYEQKMCDYLIYHKMTPMGVSNLQFAKIFVKSHPVPFPNLSSMVERALFNSSTGRPCVALHMSRLPTELANTHTHVWRAYSSLTA
jgi:hypothetical protein